MASFPQAGSSDEVCYSPGGGGADSKHDAPPVVGHSTIHLPSEDDVETPVCVAEGLIPGNPGISEVGPRVDYDADIDECGYCKNAEG